MTRSFVNRPEECSDVYRLKSPIDLKLALTRLLKSSLLADLSEIDRSLLCTLASELGSNMIKYARHGNLHVSRKDTLSFCVVEVKAADQGPGIADIEKAMAEHFSSGGTLGLGLPGVKRLADNLEISSVPRVGTTIIATKRIRRALAPVKSVTRSLTSPNPVQPISHERSVRYPRPEDLPLAASEALRNNDAPSSAENDHHLFDIGFKVRAYAGLGVSGDQVLSVSLADGCLLGIIDVTGHGPKAADLARQIVAFIKVHATHNLAVLMAQTHTHFQNTLGAAVGLAFLNWQTRQVSYLGVGNTALLLGSEKNWRPVSKEGVVGLRMPTLVQQTAQFKRHDILVMYTDGVSESGLGSELKKYAFRSAKVIAGHLVDVAGKLYDDASCLVVKWKE